MVLLCGPGGPAAAAHGLLVTSGERPCGALAQWQQQRACLAMYPMGPESQEPRCLCLFKLSRAALARDTSTPVAPPPPGAAPPPR